MRFDMEDGVIDSEVAAASSWRSRPAPWVLAAIGWIAVAVILTVQMKSRPEAANPPVLKAEIGLEGSLVRTLGNGLALSPDGETLAYMAAVEGRSALFLRPLAELKATELSDTEDGERPFFSPDGLWVGFFRMGKLEKVAISGGARQIVCDVPGGVATGATWGPDESIVFSTFEGSGLW